VPKIRFKPKLEASLPPAAPGSMEPVSAAANAPVLFTDSIVPPSMANPHVIAPSPPLFATPSAPATPLAPAAGETPSPPPTPAPGIDVGKFKLKPKGTPVVSPPATDAGAAAPFVFAPPPDATPPVSSAPPLAVPPSLVPKAPPPFPVMAPPGAVKSGPPPLASNANPTEAFAVPAPVARVPERRKRSHSGLLKLVALLVLAVGGFFAWKQFKPAPAAPAPAAKSAPTKKAPATPPANAAPTPSDTLNQLAHAPKQAIDKAQDAINARRASGQARVDSASIGEDLPDRPVAQTPAAPGKQPAASPVASRPANGPATTSTVAPGVAATAQVEAAAEATAPFRSFVANAKVSGVFQGPPTRAMINGRLTRAGEMVDVTLGVTFNGVDPQRRQLIFQDKTGATVSRRF
jgi:hypothetical protein